MSEGESAEERNDQQAQKMDDLVEVIVRKSWDESDESVSPWPARWASWSATAHYVRRTVTDYLAVGRDVAQTLALLILLGLLVWRAAHHDLPSAGQILHLPPVQLSPWLIGCGSTLGAVGLGTIWFRRRRK